MIQWREHEWIETNLIEATSEVITGQGVFETILVSNQVPLFLELHLDRLNNSRRILELETRGFPAMRGGIEQLLAAHHTNRGRLRITMFGGVPEALLMMSLVDVNPWPSSASVIISPWTRNENSATAGAKSVSYAENALALKWAKDQDFSETLLFNSAGRVAEAATSNILIVVDGEVITPPLHSGCLAGITRGIALELGVVEADIDANRLDRATAAALLSSTRGVQPIHAIGERELEVSCSHLQRIMDCYRIRVEHEKENWAGPPKESRPA